MDAVNQNIRKKSIGQFLGIYGLSLLLVLGAGFFLSSAPKSVIKEQLATCMASNAENEKLLLASDGITDNLNNIVQTDKDLVSASNDVAKGGLQSKMHEYEKNMQDGLIGLKRDTQQITNLLTKRLSQDYIVAYDALVSYRNLIGTLRSMIINPDAIAKLNADLEACRKERDIYQAMAKNGGGGGGGGGALVPVDASKSLLDACKLELNSTRKNLEDSTNLLRGFRTQTKGACPPCPPVTNTGGGVSEEQVLMNTAAELVVSSSSGGSGLEKTGWLKAAKSIYSKIQKNNPDKVKAQLDDVNAKLKKLSSTF